LALNPQYAAMGPQAREMFQSERFRQMMSNPDTLRGMMQMASVMRSAGLDPLAGPFGESTSAVSGNSNVPLASNTTSTTATPVGGSAHGGTPPAPNLIGGDPSALLQLLGGVPSSADARPPEERFQVQLQQLQDMGFTNASQNVRALLATGGNVHSAIEYILGGGGL